MIEATRRCLAPLPAGRVVLAVSGGPDSMGLLAAVHAAGLADRVACVATFDHRSGPWATRAARLVAASASGLGFRVVVGRAPEPMVAAGEAAWRDERWRFLRQVAADGPTGVATAHTRDDHLETIAFRLWRGGGPRGLAGLDVDGGPLRPLLSVARADVAAFVRASGVPSLADPANGDRRHARVRWRLDLLPALESARPGFSRELLALGARAAAWRRDVERLVAAEVTVRREPQGAVLTLGGLADVPAGHLAWCWPAILAAEGVTPDRRALTRLARETTVGQAVPLPGGAELIRVTGETWVLRRPRETAVPVPLAGVVRFGPWRFRPARADAGRGEPGTWHARLPVGVLLEVRPWRPGDRLAGPAGPRRVARWFADAGIPGPLRVGWPVVAGGTNVWWIPGVRQVALPPGTPFLSYDCDRQPD